MSEVTTTTVSQRVAAEGSTPEDRAAALLRLRTVKYLRDLAKTTGVKNYWLKTKAELVTELTETPEVKAAPEVKQTEAAKPAESNKRTATPKTPKLVKPHPAQYALGTPTKSVKPRPTSVDAAEAKRIGVAVRDLRDNVSRAKLAREFGITPKQVYFAELDLVQEQSLDAIREGLERIANV